MKWWLIGGTGLAVLGAWVYLHQSPRPAGPAPAPAVVVQAEATPAVPAPPLDRVVDVTDLDPLLDPPAIPQADAPAGPVLIRVGYEEPAAPAAPQNVRPIPKALD
jgi:hypothetical protein